MSTFTVPVSGHVCSTACDSARISTHVNPAPGKLWWSAFTTVAPALSSAWTKTDETRSGGTAPYTFSVTGGSLPAGLTLTPAGLLAGTPTAAATSNFVVRATDANGCFASAPFTTTIATAVPTLPAVFALGLTLALIAAGWMRLRQRSGGL